MADTPDAPEEDIEDVSLIDTPEAPAKAAEDTPSEPAQKPEEGAEAQDKPADAKPETPDAKTTEAKKEEDGEGDKKPDDPPDPNKPDEPKTPKDTPPADRQRIAQQEWRNRQRTRQQVEQQIDQSYAPKDKQQLIDEGLKPDEANVEALRQELAYKDERARVAELNAGLQSDAVNIEKDFPIFDEKSKEFDPEFTKMVHNQYKLAARLQTDEQGIILNAEVPLYDYYQSMANIYNRGTSKGSAQGQADMQQMMSRTENPGGSSSTPQRASDDLEELEERLGDVVIT